MTSFKTKTRWMLIFLHIFLIAACFSMIACSTFSSQDDIPDPSLQAINSKDILPIPSIAKFHPDGSREILATSPEAMRYIFYKAGCTDGSQLAGLMEHNWNELSNQETWKGACKSLKYDTVHFKISHPGNLAKYKEFANKTYPLLLKAESSGDVQLFMEALEYEPALPDARLALFRFRVEKKECKKAKRHLIIFLNLSPGFYQKKSLESYYTKTCGKL
ncbi:MAG: hypothetical protein O9346_16610 [Leptospiraceae bacterium]|nr:hypothetical protein [Leptospiraceae bacterium]